MKLSPTQIKQAACLRRWAALRLHGGFTTQTPALKFGTDYHKVAEGYLTGEDEIDKLSVHGRLFLETVPYLPKPGMVDVERHIETTYKGVTFHGYMDFSHPHLPVAKKPALVGDHKTTSGPQYALNAKTLPLDEQGILYPWILFELGDAVEVCDLHWQYADKKARRALPPVHVRVTRAEVDERFQKHIWPRVLEMQAVEQVYGPDVEAARLQGSYRVLNVIPSNPSACDFEGRFCDFAKHCNLGEHTMAAFTPPSHVEGVAWADLTFPQQLAYQKSQALANAAPKNAVPPEAQSALPAALGQAPEVEDTPATPAAEAPAPTPTAPPAEEKPKGRGRPRTNAAPLTVPSNPADKPAPSATTAKVPTPIEVMGVVDVDFDSAVAALRCVAEGNGFANISVTFHGRA